MMLTTGQKNQIMDFISRGDSKGGACLLSNLGNYLKNTLQLDWRGQAAPGQFLVDWLNQQQLPRPLYANAMRIAFEPLPPDAPAPRQLPQKVESPTPSPRNREPQRLSPPPEKLPFPLRRPRQGQKPRLRENPYPMVEEEFSSPELAHHVAELDRFAYCEPQVFHRLRLESGYSGPDGGHWRAITAKEVAYARLYPQEYILEGLWGPDRKPRTLMRVPHIKTPLDQNLYFIFEKAPQIGWTLLDCCTMEHPTYCRWLLTALRSHSRYYLNDTAPSAETLSRAITLWRTLLKEVYLSAANRIQIREVCERHAGTSTWPEMALLLRELYSIDSRTDPLFPCLEQTARRYLLTYPNLTPPLQQEVSALSQDCLSLLSILSTVPPQTLWDYYRRAGSFAAPLPTDTAVVNRYQKITEIGLCAPEEAEILLRSVYLRHSPTDWMLLRNLPIPADRPQLAHGLLELQHQLATGDGGQRSSYLHRGMCAMSIYAIHTGMEEAFLSLPGNLGHFFAPERAADLTFFVSQMILHHHWEAAHRCLQQLDLPQGMPYRPLFQTMKEQSSPSALETYCMGSPWLPALLEILMPDGNPPAYGNLVEELVWPAIRGEIGLEQLRERALMVEKMVEFDPEDYGSGFVLLLLCKQAAELLGSLPYPEDMLPLLYTAQFHLTYKFLKPVPRGTKLLDRQHLYEQMCDLVLAGCLLEAKGLAPHAPWAQMSPALCHELTQLTQPYLQRAQLRREARGLGESIKPLPLDQVYDHYRQALAALTPAQLEQAQQAIIARLTGSWYGLLASESPLPTDWLERRLIWFRDPGPTGKVHTIGLLRSLLRYFQTLTPEQWPVFRVWYDAQLRAAPTEEAQRPFLQLYALVTRIERKRPGDVQQVIVDEPRDILTQNTELLDFPIEELFLPNKLTHNELYRFDLNNDDGLQTGDEWRGRDYRRLSRRARLMILLRSECRLAMKLAHNHFVDDDAAELNENSPDHGFFLRGRKNASGQRRHLDTAYAYYHAVSRSLPPVPLEGFAHVQLVQAKHMSVLSRSCEYACHILGGVGKSPEGKNMTEAIALNALLQIFLHGREDDIPLYLSRIPAQYSNFLESLFPLFRAFASTSSEQLSGDDRGVLTEQLSHILAEVAACNDHETTYLAWSLAKLLLPPLFYPEDTPLACSFAQVREDLFLRRNNENGTGPRFVAHQLSRITPAIREALRRNLSWIELHPRASLDSDPAFVRYAESMSEELWKGEPLPTENDFADLTGCLAGTAPHSRERLLQLYRLYDHTSAADAGRPVLRMALGMETLYWQRRFIAQGEEMIRVRNVNDTLLSLLFLYAKGTPEEQASPIYQDFAGQVPAEMANLLDSYSDLQDLVKVYQHNRSGFESLLTLRQLPCEAFVRAFYRPMDLLVCTVAKSYDPDTLQAAKAAVLIPLKAAKEDNPWKPLFGQLNALIDGHLQPAQPQSSARGPLNRSLFDWANRQGHETSASGVRR